MLDDRYVRPDVLLYDAELPLDTERTARGVGRSIRVTGSIPHDAAVGAGGRPGRPAEQATPSNPFPDVRRGAAVAHRRSRRSRHRGGELETAPASDRSAAAYQLDFGGVRGGEAGGH